jgi:hypothetical protein
MRQSDCRLVIRDFVLKLKCSEPVNYLSLLSRRDKLLTYGYSPDYCHATQKFRRIHS